MITAPTLQARLLPGLLLLLAAGGAGCIVSDPSPAGRACDEAHACPMSLVCANEVCVVSAGDAGRPDASVGVLPDGAIQADAGYPVDASVAGDDAGSADAAARPDASAGGADAAAAGPDAGAGSADGGGLIMWYAMEPGDIASGKVTDRSGNGYDAVIHGSPQQVAGHVGGALKFDGVGDYLETGYSAGIAQWTVATWVKADADPGTTQDTGPAMKEENFLMSWDHQDSSFRGAAAVAVAGAFHPASFGTVHGGIWYHLAATYDGVALRSFRDGALITTTPISGVPEDCGCTMKVARHAIDASFLAGVVDEVRVYNRALSPSEVAALP